MDGRKENKCIDPRDWLPIEMVLVAVLIRIQKGIAVDVDRWVCRAVFDRICQRGYGMDARQLMREVLARDPYAVRKWVDRIMGRYLFDSDIEIALKLMEVESKGNSANGSKMVI
jgi:hypothetical protein